MNTDVIFQQRIIDSFKEVSHPGNDALLRKDGRDDSDVSFLYPYQNKNWQELNRCILVQEGSCLSALSDCGLHYVIPAFLMEFTNENFEDPNGWVDRLLRIFASKGRGSLCFNEVQSKLIDDLFLKRALETWEQYNVRGMYFGDNWGELVYKARTHFKTFL